MFTPRLSDELEKNLKKSKNRELVNATLNKIKSICQEDEDTINHYKNLQYDLSKFKRVHILKSFVLLFEVDLAKKEIIFWKLEHHDTVYK